MVARFATAIAWGVAVASASHIARAQGQVEVGRYQLAIPINSDSTALLIDTVTGRSWVLSGRNDRRWHDLNFGEVKDGHMVLTPPPCTQSNPTCYFALPQDAESPSAQKPAEREGVQ